MMRTTGHINAGLRRERFLQDGFTLIEVLFAISLVVVVVGIVYETFASITDATAEARRQSEELRIREFLTRSFSESFSTVYTDVGYYNENYSFVASGGAGSSSSEEVEFCSSAPLMGGVAPPGFFKRVHYSVSSQGSSMTLGKGGSDLNGLAHSTLVFEATETLVAMAAAHPEESSFTKSRKEEDMEDAFGLDSDSPAWNAPISGIDFSFYDGDNWVEEWDSYDTQRMPWCVRIRVNFARTEEETDAGDDGGDLADNPDFEMFIPISMGMGVWTTAEEWMELTGYGLITGTDETNATQNTTNGKNTNGTNSNGTNSNSTHTSKSGSNN
jgi:prepilin-type N-terminal cleavage/methylation domain-containing protein